MSTAQQDKFSSGIGDASLQSVQIQLVINLAYSEVAYMQLHTATGPSERLQTMQHQRRR